MDAKKKEICSDRTVKEREYSYAIHLCLENKEKAQVRNVCSFELPAFPVHPYPIPCRSLLIDVSPGVLFMCKNFRGILTKER